MSRLAVGRFDDPDHYELGGVHASGGEATLRRGWVRGPGGRIPVAIKIPLPAWAPHLDYLYGRWSEQVELLRTLHHPGVVRVRDLFLGMPPHSPGESVEGRQLYLVMEWVEGTPLDEWLLDHPDANHLRRVRSVVQVADVLDRIHGLRLEDAEAIVHRDVKPDNIMMGDDGPVLVDWGLVRGMVPNAPWVPGEGSPGYMAPEVIREGRFSPASDRFAFGCVLYYLLTGHHPPYGHDVALLRAGLLSVPGLARQQATVEHIMAMFDPEPAKRPTSCRAWLAGITRSTVPHVDGSIPPPAPTPHPPRRSRLVAGAVGLVALALGAFLLWRDGDAPSTASPDRKEFTTPSSTSSTSEVSTTTSAPGRTTTVSTTPTTRYLATDFPADYKGCERPDTTTVPEGVGLYAGPFGCDVAWADYNVPAGCSQLQATVRLAADAPTPGRLRIQVRDAVKGIDLIAPLDVGVDDQPEVDARWGSLNRVRLQATFVRVPGLIDGSVAIFDKARLTC